MSGAPGSLPPCRRPATMLKSPAAGASPANALAEVLPAAPFPAATLPAVSATQPAPSLSVLPTLRTPCEAAPTIHALMPAGVEGQEAGGMNA